VRLAVFGATGKSGQSLVTQALAAGHQVSALVRPPAKLSPQEGLSIVKGDAAHPEAVAATLDGCDAALSLLGNFNRKPNTEVSEATRVLCDAMAAHGPSRLVVVTTIGVGDSFAPLRSLVFKAIIRFVAKEIWRDRERQEAIVCASGLDWTIVRPGGLTDGPATGRWTLIDSGGAQPRKVAIARADLAAALLQIVEDRALIGQTRCIFTPSIE
jgi:putative NADH-flavin reductase